MPQLSRGPLATPDLESILRDPAEHMFPLKHDVVGQFVLAQIDAYPLRDRNDNPNTILSAMNSALATTREVFAELALLLDEC